MRLDSKETQSSQWIAGNIIHDLGVGGFLKPE